MSIVVNVKDLKKNLKYRKGSEKFNNAEQILH